jgi:hypothetical protein
MNLIQTVCPGERRLLANGADVQIRRPELMDHQARLPPLGVGDRFAKSRRDLVEQLGHGLVSLRARAVFSSAIIFAKALRSATLRFAFSFFG